MKSVKYFLFSDIC